ncbi:MAG: diguanylate cyclase [Desulforhopalus sp.]|nr:diguanylate cyclase [Desulforhopalus sp.]
MTANKYLQASDLVSSQYLKEFVHPICPAALFLASGTLPSPEELGKATLVVAIDPADEIRMLMEQDSLPASTPVLLLSIQTTIPPFFSRYRDRWLLDYLTVPVPLEIFLHRISFLCRVQRVSAEHHTNSVTLSRQLDALATRDGLTGLYNRRQLTTTLVQSMEVAKSHGAELSLLVLNIDFFNAVNKTSGQKYGDFILNEMAARLTTTSKEPNTCYRFSGEDFMVLMPGTALEEAKNTAERIRRVCSEKPFVRGKTSQSITVSMGLASLLPHQPESHDEFINMAETALFLAKAEGRNRLRVFDPLHRSGHLTPRKTMAFLKESLQHIMERTRSSAIASVQLLAKNVAGPEHQAHATTVSHYISLLGRQLGLPPKHIETFHNAIALCNSFRSLLHNDLISKPVQLSQKERKLIDDLPFKLTELTNMFDYFANEREVLMCQGERYDGTGHPRGLKGDGIPLGARIFTLIDALAAMNADRPYRRKLTAEEIVAELIKGSGKQFDPFLVSQILTVIENNHLLNLDHSVLEQARQDLFNTFPEVIL